MVSLNFVLLIRLCLKNNFKQKTAIFICHNLESIPEGYVKSNRYLAVYMY